MRAVAEGTAFGVFASTPCDATRLRDVHFEGRHSRTLVGAVAERLGVGHAAGTPPAGAGGFLGDERSLLGDSWGRHMRTMAQSRKLPNKASSAIEPLAKVP